MDSKGAPCSAPLRLPFGAHETLIIGRQHVNDPEVSRVHATIQRNHRFSRAADLNVFDQKTMEDSWNLKFVGKSPGLFIRHTTEKKKGTVAIANASWKLHTDSAICLFSDGTHRFEVQVLPLDGTRVADELSVKDYADASLRPGAQTPERLTAQSRSTLMETATKKSSATNRKVRHTIAERSGLFPLVVGAVSVPLPSWMGDVADWKDTPVMHQLSVDSTTMSLLIPGDHQQLVNGIQVPKEVTRFMKANGI